MIRAAEPMLVANSSATCGSSESDTRRLAVALKAYDQEADDVAVSRPVAVIGRKIPVDAMDDPLAAAHHLDRLLDPHRGVLLDRDLALKEHDPFRALLSARRDAGE